MGSDIKKVDDSKIESTPSGFASEVQQKKPHNNRVELIARGCHVARLRERRASTLSPFCFAGGSSAVLTAHASVIRTKMKN